MKCVKCDNEYFMCKVLVMGGLATLIVHSMTGMIDVEADAVVPKYERKTPWLCSDCMERVNELEGIHLLDKIIGRKV